ncbi:8235_t:CDS:2, partial [Gigaspora rosea]
LCLMNFNNFVSIEEPCIFPNIELNNGMSVFIPGGYSPILIREDDTKKLKTIIEIPELNIRDKIKYELIKDNSNIRIDNRQILKIAGEEWKKLIEPV